MGNEMKNTEETQIAYWVEKQNGWFTGYDFKNMAPLATTAVNAALLHKTIAEASDFIRWFGGWKALEKEGIQPREIPVGEAAQ